MNILIHHNARIPVTQYGGIERMIWWLGKYLHQLGHQVTFLVKEGSSCPFAKVLFIQEGKTLREQIPAHIDVVHLNHSPNEEVGKPYLITWHGNFDAHEELNQNSVFVSQNHASRFGSSIFVHNGLDFDDYGKPDLSIKRKHTHFLAKAAWRVKNVKGAIDITREAKQKLVVLGGNRLNLKMGFRFTPDLHVRFYGLVGGEQKTRLINESKALIFPVLWHEPFGIAITESLFMGCAVFGTPYGSLPELVPPEVGFLSEHKYLLVENLKDIDRFSPKRCHEYATDNFSAILMAKKYVGYYEEVLAGRKLNAKAPISLQTYPKFLPFLP